MSRLLSLTLIWLVMAGFASAAGKKYALVIGVKTYRPGQPLPELAFTENDADGLAKVLKAGGYDVTLMTQTVGRTQGQEVFAPLSDYIRDQLSALLESPFLKDEDVVLIALAGHGVQFEMVDDAGKKTPKFYFCPADADVAKLKTANEITDRNRLIDLGELYAALNTCKAGGKLLLVDACRNDPTKPGVTRTLASATLPPLPPPPGGTAVFFSCSAHQQAFEDKDLQHGVFFQQVIDALRGDADTSTAKKAADGEITLAELSEHVSSSTYDYVRKKYQGAKQAPELKGEFRLSIPLISVAVATPAKPKPVMPKPSPASKSSGFVAGTRAGEVQEITLPGDVKMKMVWCPPGTFTMGSPASEKDREDNENQVEVALTKGYWLGQTEVTQAQWTAVMGSTSKPWSGKDYVQEGSNYPASYVSHGMKEDGSVEADSATAFCERLTELERKASRLPSGWKYALPSEAEWEYACRAGTKTAYSFGNDESQLSEYAWWGGILGDGNAKTEQYGHAVGTKKANAWGLFDMHGNLYEWCRDGYADQPLGGADPVNTSAVDRRVLRGGSWGLSARSTRSAFRNWYTPEDRGDNSGFRVSRTQ
ncbi:MAG: SUMF1/EgtB/PvdO family nonheme iron enzyme [Planctomycetaceae bacterium]